MSRGRPALLVLVDALPWTTVSDLGLLDWLPCRQRLRPGVGYSITQKAEMLTGKLPDQLGFLNHWQPVQLDEVRHLPLQRVLDRLRDSFPLADRRVSKKSSSPRAMAAALPETRLLGSSGTACGQGPKPRMRRTSWGENAGRSVSV